MSVAATKPKGGDKEVSITAILESAFINQGIFPDKVVLSQKDFDFLGNVLEDMGFSRSRLKSFFEEIKENRSGDLITLSHFLQDLSAFEQTEDRKASLSASSLTDSIDKSAVPHLELILRDLGVPPEKMASLLSTAARETGAIDIEKLVLQLKTYSHAKEKNSSAVQVEGKDKIAKDTNTNGLQPDSSMMKKVASGLEKLGLSVPDKASHLPFTLEMFIQSLEKKVGETTSVSKNTPLELTRKAESVLEMPAVKAMKMQKTETYFGFAREMMIDKLNNPDEKGSASPTVESGWQKSHQSLMPGEELLQGKHTSFANAAAGPSSPNRQMGVSDQASLAVERMDFMLSAATRETGEIDIEKLLFQLKSYVDTKGNSSGTAQVTLDSAKSLSGHPDQLSDSQAVQRVMSGLEKLGLSVPNKASHLPFTLEMVVQFLEKKVQESALVSKNTSMDASRMTESVPEMPAVKSMKMAKKESDFGFAREMMNDKQDKPTAKDVAAKNMESQNMFFDKKIGDVSKTDGAGRQENLQTLMPGGEKLQGPGILSANVAENPSAPGKQTAAFQQNPLPAAVVNQVGKEIAAFLHRGDRIFTLQLKPPELGMVNIEMDVKENVLKMSVVTETSSAKDMLHANYVDLKRVLEGYGIRVETFDVQLNSSLNHASANGDGLLNQQQHSQAGVGKNIRSGKPGGETAEEDTAEQPVLPKKNNEALLDLLA